MPKQKKKPDPGHEETERMLREMEQKVAKEYAQAEKDMQKKLDKYFERFSVKDARKKAAVDAGTLSEEKYLEWRKNQLLIGDRWEEMRSNLALDLHNSNRIARSIVNSYMPDAYAANFNYGVFQVEKLAYANTAFTLYNREAVERILKDNPQILPPPGQQMKNTFGEFDAYKKAKEEGRDIKIDPKKQKAFDKYIKNNRDIRWQEGQLQSVVTQAVLQGESIPNMARRIANTMGEMNRKATTRYARTAMTEAQSAGRVNAYKRCKDMGIDVSQQWMATHDAFTRDSHVMLDGEIREIGKPFSNGCEYPGDPNGRPAEIWNCRCTLVPVLNKYKHFGTSLAYDGKIDGMTYDEWKAAHAEGAAAQLARYETPTAEERSNYRSFGTGEEANAYFGRRPERSLRRQDREEYDRQMQAYRESMFGEWYENLTSDQTVSIGSYSGDAYSGINGLLRGEMTEKMVDMWNATESRTIQDMIQNVESAIDNFELKDPIKVYRTCENDVLESLQLSVGSSFHDDGFGSTSVLSKKVASGNIVMEINVPAGKGHGAWINPLSGAEDEEYEFLLQRGSDYVVKGIRTQGEDTIVELDLVGHTINDWHYVSKEEVIDQWKRKGIYDEENAKKI